MSTESDKRDAEIAADVKRSIGIAVRTLFDAKRNIKYVKNEHLRQKLLLEIQELEVP